MVGYYVYILQCADSSFYVGITTDLVRRIKEHNGLLPGGARYTKMKRPVVLRYTEYVRDRATALRREYELKKLSHQQKKDLCDCATCTITV